MMMQDRADLRDYLRTHDPSAQVDPSDAELAFQLQNSRPVDPDVLERMVYLYAPTLYQWVGVLLFYRQMRLPSPAVIMDVLRRAFGRSIIHVDQFHGNASVLTWLFDLCYQAARADRAQGWRSSRHKPAPDHEAVSPESTSAYWDSVDGLPEKLRLPLILRYQFDLSLLDIANILHIQVGEVHSRLKRARQQLLVNPIASHFDRQLQAYFDGLLDENPPDLTQLLQHLEGCGLCQSSAVKVNNLERTLAVSFKRRWSFHPLGDADYHTLIQAIFTEIDQPREWWKVQISARQSIWILGLSAIFVGLAIFFVRTTPEEREFPQVKATATQQLPPLLDVPEHTEPPSHTSAPHPSQYIVPAFSSDGQWAVFAIIPQDPITNMTLPLTIELYQRETNSIQIIGRSTPGIYLPWVFWGLIPSISADGRWIAYASINKDSEIAGSSCTTHEQLNCLDIFLYDQETRLTKRISHNVLGEAANGDSFSPTVSADGQWVAFWSSASNLVDSMAGNCPNAVESKCLYIYLYNLASGNIEQIPIGTTFSGYMSDANRISLSAAGNLVAFTVSKDSLAQGEVNQDLTSPLRSWYNTEAIVYDRITGQYELLNLTQAGSLGNGDSASPVLSADGRYVVFTSTSSNLVPHDANSLVADVFIHDRTNGSVELISHNAFGGPGNDASGLPYWSGYSLNLSTDGRYVIYSSYATNLSPTAPVECNPFGSVCNLIYLYDRQTGINELINDPHTYDFSFFPQVSSDGRWISFMQSKQQCAHNQFQCSDVFLYDRQQAWTTNLTKSDEGVIMTPWAHIGNLTLPEEISEQNVLSFSPDGRWLALAGNDSSIRLWQVSTGIHPYLKSAPKLTMEVDGIENYTSLAFSPDSQWLVAGTTTRKVLIWKIPEGALLYEFEGESAPVKDLQFSPHGDQLVISSNMGVEVWRVERLQLVKANGFSFGLTPIYAVTISPQGDLVATARGDGTVWLQYISTGRVISRLGGNRRAVGEIVFSLDGRLIATRSLNGKINIWQIDRSVPGEFLFSPLKSLQLDNLYGPLSISPDNRYLATSSESGGITLLGMFDGNIYTFAQTIPYDRIDNLAFSTRGDKLAATLTDQITLWGAASGSSSTFFVHALQDNFSGSEPTPISTMNDTLMLRHPSGLSAFENLTLDQVAANSPFPLQVPTRLPANISFTAARLNSDGGIWLEYDASDQGDVAANLYIYEQFISNSQPPTMTIGASAALDQVPILTASGLHLADYVQGDWVWSRYYNLHDNSHHDIWDWSAMQPSQRLRWQHHGIFIAIYYQVSSPHERSVNRPVENAFVPLDSLLTQQDLVQIAKSMLPFSDIHGVTWHPPFHQNIAVVAK